MQKGESTNWNIAFQILSVDNFRPCVRQWPIPVIKHKFFKKLYSLPDGIMSFPWFPFPSNVCIVTMVSTIKNVLCLQINIQALYKGQYELCLVQIRLFRLVNNVFLTLYDLHKWYS